MEHQSVCVLTFPAINRYVLLNSLTTTQKTLALDNENKNQRIKISFKSVVSRDKKETFSLLIVSYLCWYRYKNKRQEVIFLSENREYLGVLEILL